MVDNKKCEKCGVDFGCGSKSDSPCWCFEMNLSQETLSELQKKYGDCLCQACLMEYAKVEEEK